MTELAVVVVGATWLATGAVLAFVMGRRGHDHFTWLVLGVLLGPFAVVLAIDASRRRELGARKVSSPAQAPEGVDVLAGVDGSDEARAAVQSALILLGPRLGRLTLATVVPHGGAHEAEVAGRQLLRQEERALALRVPVGLEVVHGDPAQSLSDLVRSEDYDLLVVGCRGRGRAPRLLGSTAGHLAQGAPVPVLISGRGRQHVV